MASIEKSGVASAAAGEGGLEAEPGAPSRWLSQGTLPIVALLFVVGLGVTYAQLSRGQAELVERTAVQHAAVYSHTLDQFRALYASEVVDTARKTGLKVSHTYLTDDEDAIPLPITLSRVLEQKGGGMAYGTTSQIYSPLPFEWRKEEGGLKDQFAEDAWKALNSEPKTPFYRIEDVKGVPSLRYAISEQMTAKCISCHNDYAGSPKTDWKVGDVRGVLEVVYPIEQAETLSRASVWDTVGILTPMLLIALLMLGLTTTQQRRWTGTLEERVRAQQKAQAALEISQREILQSERDLVQVLGSMPLSVVVLDPDGTTSYANETAAGLLGTSFDEAELLLAGSGEPYPSNEFPPAKALAGEASAVGDVELNRGGRRIPLRVSAAPIFDERGEVARAIVTLQDVSEERRLEGQARQAQRMQAVGRLAGGVAHDFNNLLTAIVSFSTFAMKRVDPANKAYTDLEQVLRAASRGEDLTRQLLSFSRHHSSNAVVVSVDRTARDVEQMLNRLMGERVKLRTELDPAAGNVKIGEGALEQVLVNLALNSRDAMQEGGEIILRTESVMVDDVVARQYAIDCPDGRYACVTVQDEGEGMDEETARQMFDPFFTTKSLGKGTGLGLSTVWGIVRQAGGKISVQSKAGEGTSIRVFIPAVDEPVAAAAAARKTRRAKGRQTVLVVEDDDVLRSIVVRTLDEHGYKAIEAASGEDALEICDGFPPDAIDMVLTDVVMPGMNGNETARGVAKLHPNVRVLFMSGYTADAILEQGVEQESLQLLQKPFAPDALAAKVAEVLDDTEKS